MPETDTSKKTDKKKGILPFLGASILSIIFVLGFFTFGSVFLQKAAFYSKYKMNGRFVNEPPYTTEFPYKNIFTESGGSSLPFRYGQWLTKSMATAFANNRFYLDKFLDYAGKHLAGAEGLKETVALLVAPIVMGALVFISYFAGIISTWVGAISNLADVFPNYLELIIMAIPLMIPLIIYPFFLLFSTGALSTGVGFSQMAMMIGFLFIMPLMDAVVREGIVNTLVKNKYIIFLSIFTLTTINAFTLLGNTEGYVSLGISIAGLLAYIIMRLIH